MHEQQTLLLYLKTILSNGSITKGAEKLFISQPYLSKYINDIERNLGFKILNRQTRPVTLTKQGAIYTQGIESLSTNYSKLISQVENLNDSNKKNLKIGINQSMASILAAPLIFRFKKSNPKERLSIIEDRSDELEKKLLDEEIDFHIRMLPLFPVEIGYTFLTEIPVYLIINNTCPLFEKGNSKIRTLDIFHESFDSIDFISVKSGSGFMRLIDSFVNQYNFPTTPCLEVKYIETAANMAYQGLGCTFIPQYFVNSDFNSSLCNIFCISKEQLSLKIVLSYLKENYSEKKVENLINSTKVDKLISAMNRYHYSEILK